MNFAKALKPGVKTGFARRNRQRKTFTMAKIIEQSKRPALIMAPNKILAAQLYSEMKEFFPHNPC